MTANLEQVLREKLGVPTEVMNALRKIQYRESAFDAQWLRAMAPRLGVAVGLAIRRLGD